jgi:hypothetical protein
MVLTRTSLGMLLAIVVVAIASCTGGAGTIANTASMPDQDGGAPDAENPPVSAKCPPQAPGHRPTAKTCTANARDAGVSTCGGGTVPVQDACLRDEDCGPTAVCVCIRPQSSGPGPCGVVTPLGNACLPGNCRVDSDCAACGSCVLAVSCGTVGGYYCQTPNDTCSSSADCKAEGDGACEYDSNAGRWACSYNIRCPG